MGHVAILCILKKNQKYNINLLFIKNMVFFENSNFSTPLLNGRIQILKNIKKWKKWTSKGKNSKFPKFLDKGSSSHHWTQIQIKNLIFINYIDCNSNNNISIAKINRFKNLVNDILLSIRIKRTRIFF